MTNLFIRVLSKLGVLEFLNIYGTVSLNKNKFKIPINQKVGFSNLFMSEPWMIDLLKIVLSVDNKKFIDVGVNIGQTLLKLKSVSSEIDYVGFEPNPMCINYVVKLIDKNNFKKTSIVPVGISESTELGVLNFFNSSSTDSSASMIDEFRADQKVYRRNFIPLFELQKLKEKINLDTVSVLKIDVEGSELEVLNSFKSIIMDKRPIILIEILPVYNDNNLFRIERQNKIQALFREADYSINRVVKKSNILLNIEEITEIGVHSDLNKCDYVMIPKNKKEMFEKHYNRWLKQ